MKLQAIRLSACDPMDPAQNASILAEIARLLESEEGRDARVRRVLELIDRLIPYDFCALLAGSSKDADLFTIPETATPTREALRSSLSDMLQVMEGNRDIEPSGSGFAHLVLPVIGADRIIGVLRMERDDPYGLHDVQLLLAVASQLGTYLAMVEVMAERKGVEQALRESEARLLVANEELERIVKERTAALRELSSSLRRSQDDERRRIARELHDSVGQYLASAKMGLESLRRPNVTAKEAQSFEDVIDAVDKCLAETRTISYLLHPPLLDDLGLSSAVNWYVDGFSQRSGIQVNLNIPPELKQLPAALKLGLFRIVQESLTNIHRHSHSQSADIQVELRANEIALAVRDYGRGMPSELLRRWTEGGTGVGVGLRSMHERTNELGGRFEIQSDQSGTLIRVTIPLSDATRKSELAVGKASGA